MRAWITVTIAWIVLLSGISVVISQDATSEILQLVNEARRSAGISPLFANAALTQAAQRHSEDMARSQQLSHVGSNGSQFWERAASAGYSMTNGAENVLSRYDSSARGAFEQWRGSQAHNANLMNPAYQEVGIAWAAASDGQVYFTMILGSRSDFTASTATSIAPQIVVPSATPFILLPTSTPFSSVSTPIPMITPTATIIADPRIATLIAPLPTNTPNPIFLTPVPTRPPIQSVQPVPGNNLSPSLPAPTAAARADLRMVYNAQWFALINNANRPLWLAGLSFSSGSGSFSAERWSVNMEEVRPNRCFMVWGVEAPTRYDAPQECGLLAWSAVNSGSDFWRDTESFRVERYGEFLGECRVAEGVCELSLTPMASSGASAAGNLQPVERPASGSGSIRLIRDEFGLALINLSGRVRDLSGLVFESESGVFLASQWNTPNLTRSLSSYPDGDCLQVWGVGTVDLPKPGGCRYRHAWVVVAEEAQFWRSSEYRVRVGSQVIATCRMDVCELSLP